MAIYRPNVAYRNILALVAELEPRLRSWRRIDPDRKGRRRKELEMEMHDYQQRLLQIEHRYGKQIIAT